MEAFLAEKIIPKQVVGPVSFSSAQTGNTRVDMRNAKRVTFIVSVGTSTSATAGTFTLQQSNAASSGTTKVCAVSNPYYVKVSTSAAYTRVDPASAASLFDLFATVGDLAAVVIFEVLAEDLDVTNDFGWISLDTGAAGVAKLGSVVALVDVDFKPAYLQTV